MRIALASPLVQILQQRPRLCMRPPVLPDLFARLGLLLGERARILIVGNLALFEFGDGGFDVGLTKRTGRVLATFDTPLQQLLEARDAFPTEKLETRRHVADDVVLGPVRLVRCRICSGDSAVTLAADIGVGLPHQSEHIVCLSDAQSRLSVVFVVQIDGVGLACTFQYLQVVLAQQVLPVRADQT